ncbi:I78 family peptidase inhibitor [Sphingorhabdus sp.]|uniref:I78 family peptidase inhibitor n=1 Tax=Sphingorhabdus sp. TaxID=1902408 RepID=UPI0032B7457C
MKRNLAMALALPLALVSLSGCIPATENAEAGQIPPEQAGSCDAAGLEQSVGKTLNSEFEAKLKSDAKASVVRVAPHNGAITMDYSPVRLNIFIDEARKIIRINCG